MNLLSNIIGVRSGDIVAVIGAGGKHSLMSRLGQELEEDGRIVVLTSTTNLHRSGDSKSISTLMLKRCHNWPQQLTDELAQRHRIVLVDREWGPNMYRGINPSQIEQISAAAPEAVILIKADGARKRLLKMPAESEPVFGPQTDRCILVLSLAAIGKPFGPQYVHRLDRFTQRLTQSDITAQTIVDAIIGPGGYAPRLPHTSHNVLYLSHGDTPERLEAARHIWDQTCGIFHQQIAGDTMQGSFVIAESGSGNTCQKKSS